MRPDHRFLDDLVPTANRVEPARVIDDAEAENWDAVCDVLVVGLGMAGVCAALRTAEDRSLDVIAIDRGAGGGASKLSGGVVYMGGGTKAQREAGLEDSPENMANYLTFETGNIVRGDTVRRFAKASGSFQDWLEKYGARFGGPATVEKTSYPNEGTIYFSGNEVTVPGRERATAVQRGHRAKPPKGGEPTKLSGQYLLPPLIASLERQPNARLFRQTRATRMVVDQTGAVVGIEVLRVPPGFAAWRHAKYMDLVNNLAMGVLGWVDKLKARIVGIEQSKARPMRIRARKGVVLSAGGFIFNRTMLEKLAPDYLGVAPLGTIADDGSGIKLGMTVGARTDMLERISAWKFLYPPASFTKSVSIDGNADRLVNEEFYGARTGEALFGRAGGKGWLILDAPLWKDTVHEMHTAKKMFFQKVQYRAIENDYTVSADTLEELAVKIGVPPERLAKTIADYNASIDAGTPDALVKSDKLRRKIVEAPFYANDIGLGARFSPTSAITVGGLVVDEDTGEVLSSDGGKVPGLYAAGRNAVGICSHYYVSGLSLGDCIWSGLRAAETIKGNGGVEALA
ncbi:FAD-binding protein [Novosphingobium sp. G106]|uniref:FAD-binding protein n=1 Tax=Novosphingobium sp. G106 TaxID=2849500 RepID=UPI001C2DA8B8|nr:FAD-binding protein [Novosphingobium sp. G106]MBV1690661.1 FAD-binding protein [Novosphingobium sp. G106]